MVRSRLFRVANRLWFEGRTARAIAAYDAALRRTPNDPVLRYQYATVLLAVDRVAEARAQFARALALADALSERGREVLATARARFEDAPREQIHPEWTPARLDRDVLAAERGRDHDWITIAEAAKARGMGGLAGWAVARWRGVPIDADDAKDIARLYHNRRGEELTLESMYPGAPPTRSTRHASRPARPAPAHDLREPPRPHPRARARAPAPAPARVPAAAAAAAPAPAPPPRRPGPLELTLTATPVVGRVGVPTTLRAVLRNVSAAPLVVNGRMLLAPAGGDGEVRLWVRGPPGYHNTRGFRVRAGPAAAEFYVALAPGEALEQSWALDRYASLHLPGEYDVTMAYRSAAARAPDGRPAFAGDVVEATRLRRY